ncbi:hypothetical protein M4D48_19590 [Alkalihalobacillus clausii]|jgi:hypothetical protein|uniref:hypothetical protein n=1 Tax=Shouchella clausii TaxID=79880 RepID=UPI00203E0B5D|nr:hypothetical protein [Shouchella clausii]MCM3550769.1 hypothetical protein [Shouchella clausii]
MIPDDTGAVVITHQFKEPPSYVWKRLQLELSLKQLYVIQAALGQSLRASLGASSGAFIDALEEKEKELTRDMAMRIELVSSEARQATELAENYLENISKQRVSLHYRYTLNG